MQGKGTHPDLSLHNRKDAHTSLPACQHRPSLLVFAETSRRQGNQGGEQMLQPTSVTLQLAPFHCHLALAVQDAVAECGCDSKVSNFASGPAQDTHLLAHTRVTSVLLFTTNGWESLPTLDQADMLECLSVCNLHRNGVWYFDVSCQHIE